MEEPADRRADALSAEEIACQWSDEEIARRWAVFAAAVGIPKRLRGASFSGRPSPALDHAKQWADRDAKEGRCLLLTGPTGVGKSFAAVAALRALSDTATLPETRRFIYFASLCGALLDPARRASALERAKRTELVVFDDFGTEYVKDGGLVETFTDEIIWHREAEILPTIITTNLTADQLRDRLSDRIVDRLRGEWGRVFAVQGASLRSENHQ